MKIVILIQSDPRVSHRPAEAVRIALGLALSHSVELILTGAAVSLLAEESEDPIIDAEEAQDYLGRLREWGVPIWILRVGEEENTLGVIPSREMADKILCADRVLRF